MIVNQQRKQNAKLQLLTQKCEHTKIHIHKMLLHKTTHKFKSYMFLHKLLLLMGSILYQALSIPMLELCKSYVTKQCFRIKLK